MVRTARGGHAHTWHTWTGQDHHRRAARTQDNDAHWDAAPKRLRKAPARRQEERASVNIVAASFAHQLS
jgi:hypothetical protein